MKDISTELERAAIVHRCTELGGLLQWAMLHIQNKAEAIEELRADFEEEHDERLRFEKAAHNAKAAIDAALAAITEAMPAQPLDFASDLAGHINLMACHGDSDYLKSNGQSIRHIDTRESRPRKRKQ